MATRAALADRLLTALDEGKLVRAKKLAATLRLPDAIAAIDRGDVNVAVALAYEASEEPYSDGPEFPVYYDAQGREHGEW